MWFQSKRKGRKRKRSNRRRASVLNVKAPRDGKRSARRISSIAFVVLILVAAVAVGALGVNWMGELLFSRNDRFAIERLEIKGGAIVTPELIREWTQIGEGMNLFAFNIRKVRHKFLQRAPNVRSIQIQRRLPSTLRIEVEERIPLARVGRSGPLVTDRRGFVFGLRTGTANLPSLVGYRAPALRPGTRLEATALAALQVLDACEDPRLGLSIDAIGVSHPEHLVLYRSPGEGPREIALWWEGMGRETESSQRRMMKRLGRISQVLGTDRARQVSRLDATHSDPGKIYGR